MEWFFLAVIGASIGSFFNVLIHRVPRGEDIVYERSHCAKCNHQLKNWHNIPIVSWLILKGKCYFCKEKISIRYPLVEFLTMLIYVAVFYKNGFNIDSAIISTSFALLLVLSAIDIDYHAVPDSINLFTLTLALFSGVFIDAIFDALIVAGAFVLLKFYTSYAFKKETMGDGDIIIGATMGALLGFKLAFISVFIAAVISILFHFKYKELPFVPFLTIGAFLVFCFEENILGLF